MKIRVRMTLRLVGGAILILAAILMLFLISLEDDREAEKFRILPRNESGLSKVSEGNSGSGHGRAGTNLRYKDYEELKDNQSDERNEASKNLDLKKLSYNIATTKTGVNGPFNDVLAEVRRIEKEKNVALPSDWIQYVCVNDTNGFLLAIKLLREDEVVSGFSMIAKNDSKSALNLLNSYIVDEKVYDECEDIIISTMLDQDSIAASTVVTNFKDTNPRKFQKYKNVIADWLKKKGDVDQERAWRNAE